MKTPKNDIFMVGQFISLIQTKTSNELIWWIDISLTFLLMYCLKNIMIFNFVIL